MTASNQTPLMLKVIILGDSGVGKTSLLNRYVKRQFFHSTRVTITDFVNKDVVVNHRPVNLQIWDTAGAETFDSLQLVYFRGADCCMLVFDVTSRKSFINVQDWKRKVLEETSPRDPNNFPFVIVGNKTDIDKKQHNVSSKDVERYSHTFSNESPVKYFETSAKTGVNVDEAFQHLWENAVTYKTPLHLQQDFSERSIRLEEDTGHATGKWWGWFKNKLTCS